MAPHVSPLNRRLATAFAAREKPTEARLFYGEAAGLPIMQLVAAEAARRAEDAKQRAFEEKAMYDMYAARDWEGLDAFAPDPDATSEDANAEDPEDDD